MIEAKSQETLSFLKENKIQVAAATPHADQEYTERKLYASSSDHCENRAIWAERDLDETGKCAGSRSYVWNCRLLKRRFCDNDSPL